MSRERSKIASSLADTSVLLDVLGNETRRRILNLISHEPMYFNQLAREMGIDEIERRLICSIMEGPMHQKEELRTISELAEILDLNERTIRSAISRVTDKLEMGTSIQEFFKNLS
jgi:DNA-binding transcriptional ArsR family regulator